LGKVFYSSPDLVLDSRCYVVEQQGCWYNRVIGEVACDRGMIGGDNKI
jgi:hypothetical protein